MFYSKTANKIWLEANTERSESNPGRSLGIITSSKKNCLTIRILSTKKIEEKFANTDYYPYLCIRFSIGKQKERCSSG